MNDKKLVHNERVKSTSQYLNNLSIAFFATGILAPVTASVIDYSKNGVKSFSSDGVIWLVAFTIICLLMAVFCRIKGLSTLGRLENEK